MPPATLLTSVKPFLRKYSAAPWLALPWWQMKAMPASFGMDSSCFITSRSSTSEPSMKARARSASPRMSTRVMVPARRRSASSVTVICLTGAGAPGRSMVRPSPCMLDTQSMVAPRARWAVPMSMYTFMPLLSATISWPCGGPRSKRASQLASTLKNRPTPSWPAMTSRIFSAAISVMVTSGGERSGASAPRHWCSSPEFSMLITMSQPPISSPSM